MLKNLAWKLPLTVSLLALFLLPFLWNRAEEMDQKIELSKRKVALLNRLLPKKEEYLVLVIDQFEMYTLNSVVIFSIHNDTGLERPSVI